MAETVNHHLAGSPVAEGGDAHSAAIAPGDAWVVIAAYNEQEVISDVVRGLEPFCPNVLVVDDASDDDTAALARGAGAVVVRHPINLGQGAALQTGLLYALERGAQWIVTFDADGQHDPQDIPALLNALGSTGADVAFGSRFLGAAVGLPFWRRRILRLAVLFTGLTTGLWMTDAHNGLRAFTRSAAQKVRIRHNRMAHASEIIEQTARLKLKYVEVPVKVSYTPYSLRKGQKLSNSLGIFLDLLSQRMHR